MTMKIQFILISLCVTLAASFDLGPYIRIGQCRSQCLKDFSEDSSCDPEVTGTEAEAVCNECWHHCENLEYQWETYKNLCENEEDFGNCTSCRTICNFRKTRVMEEYLPSALPAPGSSPARWKKYEIAILFTKVNNEWKDFGYYTSMYVHRLRPNSWVVVISGDGIKHYAYDEWVPTLKSLKPGALYEATISWKNIESQIRKHSIKEQKEFNDRVRQFFLEKYGHRVIDERPDTKGSSGMLKEFFFQRRNNTIYGIRRPSYRPSTSFDSSDDFEEDVEPRKESWVVAWEPEAGGLMGNQEADSNSAQITLLPGTKYRVRVASKDGPGSFPIEVDTRPTSTFIEVHQLKKNSENMYAWGIIAASTSLLIFITVFIIIKLLTTKSKKIPPSGIEGEEV